MKVRTILASCMFALAVPMAGVIGAPTGALASQKAATPSIRITSTSVKAQCITVKVKVSNFMLVKPQYKNIKPLKGNEGHIHYVLNGQILPTRDATTALSHTFCGKAQFVKKGKNAVEVYLAHYDHTMFPGTKADKRTVDVM